MYRYSEYGKEDYSPNIYKHQYKYFHPTPIYPTVAVPTVHWSNSVTYPKKKSTTESRHLKNIQNSTNTWERIGQNGGGLLNEIQSVRRHSLQKMVPWRELSDTASTSSAITNPTNHNSFSQVMNSQDRLRDLVTSSNILAAHGSRTNTWTGAKFSPRDWNHNTSQLCSGAQCIHNTVTMVQHEAQQCIDETGKNQVRCSVDTSEDLSKRLDEVTKWTDKLRDELKHNIAQSHELSELKDRVEESLQNIEKPLEMSKENQHSRNTRQGVELVRDAVEEALLRETDVFQKRHALLLKEMEKINSQLARLRAVRNEIEIDIQQKVQAKQTDECVKFLSSLSKEIGPINIPHQYSRHTSPTAWLQYTQNIILKSQDERNLAQMLSVDVSREKVASANDCFGVWYATNAALKNRISEILGAKKTIEHHLHKLNEDINTLRSHIEEVQKALAGKTPQLQLAQSRLEKRKERPGLELCRDKAMMSLLREIQTLRNAVDVLSTKQKELETTLEHLLKTKSAMERDLKLKSMALFVDKEKCLMLRQCYPISTFEEARSAKPVSVFLDDRRKEAIHR